ncbi:MAG: rhamnulokinase [Chloroflexota bacterium]|nr:rhamnulokinase [Chloroflexota bacterium]
MSEMEHFLALDLGAESGRAILGTLADDRLELSEEHRFLTGADTLPMMGANAYGQAASALVWDMPRIWNEVKQGIRLAARQASLTSLGVDTWGVDFALLGRRGELLGLPYHYRDSRTDGMLEAAFERMPKEELYQITGIQFMQISTLYQLLSMVLSGSPQISMAETFLMIPDLLHYWLSGTIAAEFTNATTTQCLDSRKRQWSQEILTAMGIPKKIFPAIVMPGTKLGALRAELAQELDCCAQVIAPATHDTGAAVSAVPAEGEDFVWISSGTWSIVGMNLPEPVIGPLSLRYNFTNEGGLDGSYRFSKNVMGLWIVQQCRSQWQQEGSDYSYDQLTEMAAQAPHLKAFIDPDYDAFLGMGGMVDKVREYLRQTGQPQPANEGEVLRAVLQGLALRYRYVIEKLEEVSGRAARTVHVIGGGTQNRLLNQFTADASGKVVLAGPVEATAVGNLITQARAAGVVRDGAHGTAIIRNSFPIETFQPQGREAWDAAYESFKINMEKTKLAF